MPGNLYVADESRNGIVRLGGFPQGVLNCQVADDTGNPLAGARVHVYTDDPLLVGQVVYSDSEGHFSIPAAPRTYTLVVSADGFVTYTQGGITMLEGQEITLEFILEN